MDKFSILICYLVINLCHKYWDIKPPNEFFTNEKVINEIAYQAILDSIYKRLPQQDEPIGVLLSGGLDSGTIASILKKIFGRGVIAYTIVFEDAETLSEIANARRISEWLEIPLKVISITPKDLIEPIMNILEFDELVCGIVRTSATFYF